MKNKTFNQIQYDRRACIMLSICMLFAILTSFFGAISARLFGNTKVATYIIYAIALIFIYYQIFRIKTTFRKYTSLFLVFTIPLLVLLINYFVFPSSREYFKPNFIPLILEILIWIPVGFFAMYIKNWNCFFDVSKYSPCIIAVMGILGVGVLNFLSIYTYMDISNALLPGFLIGWYLFYKRKSLLNLMSSIIIFILQLLYGSRMSMLSCVIFVIALFATDLIWRKNTKKKDATVIVSVSLIVLLTFIFLISASDYLKVVLGDSRTIQTILSGNFVSSSSRDTIYEYARDIIANQGLGINGLFGDRIMLLQYMPGGSMTTGYVHNIFYEFVIDFGIFLGPVFLFFVFMPFFISLFRKNNVVNKDILIVFFCLIMLRLFVSGSWLVEGQFFIFVFASYNVFLNNRTAHKNVTFSHLSGYRYSRTNKSTL